MWRSLESRPSESLECLKTSLMIESDCISVQKAVFQVGSRILLRIGLKTVHFRFWHGTCSHFDLFKL